jgi:V8-like Glu-specific endopeptidase
MDEHLLFLKDINGNIIKPRKLYGTGVRISKDLILTVAHNYYNHIRRGTSIRMTFYPGFHINDQSEALIVEKVCLFKDFKDNPVHQASLDIAILKILDQNETQGEQEELNSANMVELMDKVADSLNGNILELIPPTNLLCEFVTHVEDLKIAKEVFVVGFPGDSPFNARYMFSIPITMHITDNSNNKAESWLLCYEGEVRCGLSGGGVWIKVNDKYYLIGLHIQGTHLLNGKAILIISKIMNK